MRSPETYSGPLSDANSGWPVEPVSSRAADLVTDLPLVQILSQARRNSWSRTRQRGFPGLDGGGSPEPGGSSRPGGSAGPGPGHGEAKQQYWSLASGGASLWLQAGRLSKSHAGLGRAGGLVQR